MLQIKPVIIPATIDAPESLVLLPDGLLHPRFAPKKLGMGVWVTAHAFVIEQLYRKRTCSVLIQKTIAFLPLTRFCRPTCLQ